MPKRILYVVHRYAPYPGGSENFVRDMAEETLSRGHDVWVLTEVHKGNLNGVKVSSDYNILLQEWDLIVVHGGGVHVQDNVLANAANLKSPMLYMLIAPVLTPTCIKALQDCRYIGYSTNTDREYLIQSGVYHKSVLVRHSIAGKGSVGEDGFKKKYGISTSRMFLSSGGFWPNKAMKELVTLFNEANVPDTTLVLTGYDNRYKIMPEETEFVKPFLVPSRDDVMSAVKEADLYILHSTFEGFGLVLLESMYNNTQWAARRIAGAETMKDYGFTYTSDQELIDYMRTFTPDEEVKRTAYDYVVNNRMIQHTVDDILKVLS